MIIPKNWFDPAVIKRIRLLVLTAIMLSAAALIYLHHTRIIRYFENIFN